jgi:hypothetical protein
MKAYWLLGDDVETLRGPSKSRISQREFVRASRRVRSSPGPGRVLRHQEILKTCNCDQRLKIKRKPIFPPAS